MKSVLPYMRHRDTRRPCEEIKGRQRLNGTAVRNDDRHQTLEKARNGVSPGAFRGSTALLNSGFQTSVPQKYERISSCYFKSPNFG